MKTTILGSAVALAWCVAAPFAQQPPAANPPAHNVFIATGCLSATGTAAPSFTLTDVSSVGRSAPAPTAEAGAVGTSGRKESYELEPASGVNAQGLKAEALKAHVGHRVEVTLRPIATVAPVPTTGASLGVQGKPIDAPRERFSVTELTRVTGPCS